MILIGIGTDRDAAVSDSVEVIRRSSNAFSVELHHPVRLNLAAIMAVINTDEGKRIFIVSHGNQSALLDASRERAPYLQAQHAYVLRNCYVFAHACSTGVDLAREVATETFLYLGFDAPVSAPPQPRSICFDDVVGIFAKLAAFMQHVEYADPTATGIQVQCLLDALKEDVLAIERKYDTDDGTRLDAEEMICIRQFRDDICAWVRGLDRMLKCKDARPSPYLWGYC
jgi:hypothetical protein